jgi:5S rRNA maturation endonuclease (ribonuclease M5)
LEYYGIGLNRKGPDQLVGCCPLPEHAGDRDNENAFHVNIIDLARAIEGYEKSPVGFRKAALKIQDLFLSGKAFKAPEEEVKRGRPKKEETPPEEIKNLPLDFTLEKRIKPDHPFLTSEKGLDMKIIKKFGLGYCFKGMMAGRVVIPIHNVEGKIVAYAGRAIKKHDQETRGKYLFPSGFTKSVELFNYHRVASKNKLLREYGVIVVEGFFDAIKLTALGYPNVVALMGWSLSEIQEKLLLSLTNKILLFLDNDEAGIEATEKTRQSLIHKAFIKIARYPDGEKTQPEDFSQDELKTIL